MILGYYKGYREGQDISKISSEHLTYPSKNVFCYKGSILTRGGLKNDGTTPTENTPIHSEYVWKSAPGGAKALRVFGQTLQVKWGGIWITLFTGFSASTTKVRFAPWVDINGSIIKSRLFMVDGSDKIYEWNGSIATVASYSSDNITISGSNTLLQLGFDSGASSPQNVRIVRMSGGQVAGIEAYQHNDDCTDLVLHLTSTPNPVPQAGDYVISSVVERTGLLTGFDKDEIYTYKNHLFAANFDTGRIYYSHATTYPITFTIPGTKTALTADLLDLDGKFTAIISRKDVLWISTIDDWFKITKTAEQNAYGYWTNVEKFEQAERTGALPYAVAIQKGDVIFIGQNKYIYKITSLEIIGTDEIRLMSDYIDGLLLRLDPANAKIYYHERYIFVVYPMENTLVVYDVIEEEWQPPQIAAINCISVIDGVRYGHSNSNNETAELFSGRNDLGIEIEAIIAPGYIAGEHLFRYQKFTLFGLHARATITTKVKISHYYEESGAKALSEVSFDVSDIKTYEVSDDVMFGSQSIATRSLAGVEDSGDNSLKPFYIFDKQPGISYFNYRPVLTLTGVEVDFRLLGWHIDNNISEMKIGSDLFIQK